MNIEFPFHNRPEFIAWYSALTAIDQLLVGAIPILFFIYLVTWAMHSSASQYQDPEMSRPSSAFTPILLLLLSFVGLLWLLATPEVVEKTDHLVITPDTSTSAFSTSNESFIHIAPPPSQPMIFPSPDDCPGCSGPAIARGAEFSVGRADDMHFYVPGTVNGVSVVFMVDTGATWTSLPLWMANRVGVTSGRGQTMSTANGIAMAMQTSGQRVDLLGEWHDYVDVQFMPALDRSILGQNVLMSFDLETKGDRLYFHGH